MTPYNQQIFVFRFTSIKNRAKCAKREDPLNTPIDWRKVCPRDPYWGNHGMLTLLLAQVNNVYHTLALNTLAWGITSCLSDQISRQYNLFQNGCHATILLFLFKLPFVASFLRANFKRIFHLQRGSKD